MVKHALTTALAFPLLVVTIFALCLNFPALSQGPTPSSQASATPAPTYTPLLTFDVASIRPSDPDPHGYRVGGWFAGSTSSISITNVDPLFLLEMAYGLSPYKIAGLPDWTRKTKYNVHAKGDAAADKKLAKLSPEQRLLEDQHMLQTLLADRFNLKVHWATQERPIYNLTLAHGGSKLLLPGTMPVSPDEKKWFGDRNPPPIHQQGNGQLGYEYFGHSCPIGDLTSMVSAQMSTDVVDKTGLTGNFDFHLQYNGRTPSDNDTDDPTKWPPLNDALPQQLGLKLESAKGPVRVLVIDHIDPLSDN